MHTLFVILCKYPVVKYLLLIGLLISIKLIETYVMPKTTDTPDSPSHPGAMLVCCIIVLSLFYLSYDCLMNSTFAQTSTDNTSDYEEETPVLNDSPPIDEDTTVTSLNQMSLLIQQASSSYMDDAALMSLSNDQLSALRNGLYAIEGRIFSDDLGLYFAQFDWYSPSISPQDFSWDLFNNYEAHNLKKIIALEKSRGIR